MRYAAKTNLRQLGSRRLELTLRAYGVRPQESVIAEPLITEVTRENLLTALQYFKK